MSSATSQKSNIKVSVLMPVYNHEAFVEKAVRSVWNQSYKNIELVAIDDGSSDRSLSIIKEMAKFSPIPMIVETQSNSGICATLNRCNGLAHGEWVSLLASDDYYHEDYVETCVQEACKLGDVLIHTDAYRVNESGKLLNRFGKSDKRKPYQGNCFWDLFDLNGRIIASTMFLKRSLLLEVGGFDESLSAEDYDFQLRASRIVPFFFIDEPLVYKRYVPAGLGKNPWRWADGNIRLLEKHRDVVGDKLSSRLRYELVRLAKSSAMQGSFIKADELFMRSFVYGKNRKRKLMERQRFLSLCVLYHIKHRVSMIVKNFP